jgi:hypothetical protein
MNTAAIISFTDSHFFVGIDTHLKNWKVTIRLNSIELKTFSMNPSPIVNNKNKNIKRISNCGADCFIKPVHTGSRSPNRLLFIIAASGFWSECSHTF